VSTLPRRQKSELERRLAFEGRHPEVSIKPPIVSRSQKWEVHVPDEGTALYDNPQTMLDALEERYG
jgi:hypothetical protein